MNSVVAWVVAVAAAAFLVGPVSAEVPMPKPSKAYKGEQCVEPVETMRRYHMDYLMHQRDETVQQGIRGRKYSLTKCIECHATKVASVGNGKSVGGKGQSRTIEPFCANCHKYAAVTIDCFECHTSSPAEAQAGKDKTGKAKAGQTLWPAPAAVDRMVSELRAYLGNAASLDCKRPVG